MPPDWSSDDRPALFTERRPPATHRYRPRSAPSVAVRNAQAALRMSPPGGATPRPIPCDPAVPRLAAAAPAKEPGVIVPPPHFSVVEPGLYRCSLPNANHFPFIRSLRLKMAIILSAERPVRSITNLFETHQIEVSHTGLHAWTSDSSWKPISEEVVKESLEKILCAANYPVLVCDIGGVHLVGMVTGCLRRLQNWNLNSVVNEYRGFAGAKTRYVNEQFIELFDIDLVTIPDNPPKWFAEQLEMDRRDREDYEKLIDQRRVDESGGLTVPEKAPRYLVYYYSSASPLNSEEGGKEPLIQIL